MGLPATRHSGTDGCRQSPKPTGSTAPTCLAAASRINLRAGIDTLPRRSARRLWRYSTACPCQRCTGSANPLAGSSLLLAAAHPDRIASLVLCNTPTRIPDHIKRSYALGHASASEAMRASGVGAWCRQTLGNRLDLAHASEALCDWVVREMDRTAPCVAAAMHDCFESVDVSPLLPSITAPVLLLSGDNSPIASAQQKALAETLPNGRVELFAGYGHGVNLLQPERCSRAALEFWRSNV